MRERTGRRVSHAGHRFRRGESSLPAVVAFAREAEARTRDAEAAQGADVNTFLKRLPFLLLPGALFRLFVWAFAGIGRRYARLWKATVGMFGAGAGWGIPPATPTTLMLTVGGIGEKQAVVDGHAAVREYLSLTISVDHDIVDGAPAARDD